MKKLSKLLSILLSICLLLPMAVGCADTSDPDGEPLSDGSFSATNLMADVTPSEVADREPDDAFQIAYADFTAKLFTASAALEREDNLLLSPLSAMLALAMTANGAKGETLAQMEALLGGTLSAEELNATLRTWIADMAKRQKVTLNTANSIWFKEKRFVPDPAFLQKNADYYGADVYAAPFSDQTVKDVNSWIEEKTNGLIKEMLSELDPETVMLLINTLYFEAAWSDQYSDHQLEEGVFHGVNRDETVQMMRSTESSYISTEGAQGFKKSYRGGFTFAALLPDEGTDIADFVASLTGEKLLTVFKSGTYAEVHAKLPAFSYDCNLPLKDVLEPLIPDAFTCGVADFSGMGTTDSGDRLYISDVLQKTTITLDKNGTAAAAATVVVAPGESDPPELPVYEITLDRPFVYAIVDNATNLPVFIGVVEQL